MPVSSFTPRQSARIGRMFGESAIPKKAIVIQAEFNQRMKLAKQRGEVYLEYAEKYLAKGDHLNARSVAEEGLMLSAGPFVLAVRDQLQEFLKKPEMASAGAAE